jgi:hypothetical protein
MVGPYPKTFTVKELQRFENKCIYVPWTIETERLWGNYTRLNITLQTTSEMKSQVAISRAYTRSPGSIRSVHEIPLLQPEVSYFKAYGYALLVVVLNYYSSGGTCRKMSVIFGEDRAKPWCQIAEDAVVFEIDNCMAKTKQPRTGSQEGGGNGKAQKFDSFEMTPRLDELLGRGSKTDRCKVSLYDAEETQRRHMKISIRRKPTREDSIPGDFTADAVISLHEEKE